VSEKYGELVPIPTAPPYCASKVVEATLRVVRYAVEEAMRPDWNHIGVEVALTERL
jgi:hypothetical protein